MNHSTCLERSFPWKELRDVSRREGTSRPPVYGMHRWWARRSPTLFRHILAAARLHADSAGRLSDAVTDPHFLEGVTVLDPFAGGGTTVVEARALGADVVAFDTELLACRITSAELHAASAGVCWADIDSRLAEAQRVLSAYWPQQDNWAVLHYFWVDRVHCSSCRHAYDAHPSALLAQDYARGRAWAFCLVCSRLHQIAPGQARLTCTCGATTRVSDGNAESGLYLCPHCGCSESIPEYIARRGVPQRRLVAKELLNRASRLVRTFASVNRHDLQLYDRARIQLNTAWHRLPLPSAAIPAGRTDGRPQIYGVLTWPQMFNHRQLLHHGIVLEALTNLAAPGRDYALLAFSESLATNSLWSYYATDYRRLTAAFSIHGYMYVSRPVELNPWVLGSGRGTLLNCVRKVQRAISAAYPGSGSIRVVHGSSESLVNTADSSVDIVLTDPPFYHDNVEYHRLAAFYSAWWPSNSFSTVQAGSGVPLEVSLDGEFGARLGAVFSECRRVLKPDGIFAFTFAHARTSGWAALHSALSNCDFSVTAVLPVQAEGSNGFHSKAGNLKWNGLFICRPAGAHVAFDPAPLLEAIQLGALSDADRLNLQRALEVATRLQEVTVPRQRDSR